MWLENWTTNKLTLGDGGSANMAEGVSCEVYIRSEVPWIFMFWCLAHCHEFSVKGPFLLPFTSFFCIFTTSTKNHLKMP